MNARVQVHWAVSCILIVCLLTGCGSPKQASPYVTWTATTGFGTLDITFKTDLTRLSRLDYTFSNWTCGSAVYNTELVDGSDWPVTGSELSATLTLDTAATTHLFLDGKFDSSRKTLAGTWKLASPSGSCSGAWQASAKS